MKRDLSNQLIIISILFILVFLVGVIGFKVIGGEKWTFFDALYMTVITMTTVGFGEVHPLSVEGRIFCIFLLIGGLGIIASAVSTMTAFLVEGELSGLLRRRKMENKIKNLSNHLILCGIGKVGFWIAEELTKIRQPFVVIEKDKNRLEEALNDLPNLLYIEGDATHNLTLREAGIERAKGLITTLTTDQENLFVTLSARSLNPKLRIVSRATSVDSEDKFRRAGADEVVFPNIIGGLRMASLMIRPTVVSFLDTMLRAEEGVLRIEEAEVCHELSGKKVHDLREKEESLRIRLLAIKEKDTGKYLYNPELDKRLKKGDSLILLGEIDNIHKFRKFL